MGAYFYLWNVEKNVQSGTGENTGNDVTKNASKCFVLLFELLFPHIRLFPLFLISHFSLHFQQKNAWEVDKMHREICHISPRFPGRIWDPSKSQKKIPHTLGGMTFEKCKKKGGQDGMLGANFRGGRGGMGWGLDDRGPTLLWGPASSGGGGQGVHL